MLPVKIKLMDGRCNYYTEAKTWYSWMEQKLFLCKTTARLFKMLLFSKAHAEVTRIGVHLYWSGLLSCTEIFHQKESKFCHKCDGQKSFLICKGKPIKDFYFFSVLKYTYSHL